VILIYYFHILDDENEPPTTLTQVKKTTKGVFKNSGTVLTQEQQDKELALLNPMTRGSFVASTAAPMRPSKHSYIHSGRKNSGPTEEVLDDDEDVVEKVGKCTNSTGTFCPPYWSFIFSDVFLRDYVCITINIPSGLVHKHYGLEGKVDATVSACKTKLEVACEWPETMTTATCLEDALSVEWNSYGDNGTQGMGMANTVSNILQAFEKELLKVRQQNKVTTNLMLGATAIIILPFQVETEPVLCQPNLDRKMGSCNLYVVLKRTVKKQDLIPAKRMAIRVSDGYNKGTSTGMSTGNGNPSTGRGYPKLPMGTQVKVPPTVPTY
jgi:hypothetical protein